MTAQTLEPTGERAFRFSDGAAYERFMGPWTRAVGALFLDWLAPQANLRWLDAGCGTGVFTGLLAQTTHPAEIVAIDPAPAQIAFVREQAQRRAVRFEVGDAQHMPFPDAGFDIVVSALVLNFIPDPVQAVREMRRVVRPGGCVAGYVWDFTGPLSVTRHVTAALRAVDAKAAPVPGVKLTTLDALRALFEQAGLCDVETSVFEVEVPYVDFADYWRRFLENPSPASAFIHAMTQEAREALRDDVRARLPVGPEGSIAFASRAHAVRGFAPTD
jgi:SAM-dependent methyltransferase